MMIKTFRVT